MISREQFQKEIEIIIANAIREDVGDGDHSSLACIPETALGRAKLLVKDKGVIAGVEFAKKVFKYVDKRITLEPLIEDGSQVKFGDIVFYVQGPSQSILKAERLILNAMQRMSAIATKTRIFVNLLKGTQTKILDTRKTTPGIRALEKWAVTIGGGENHRFALYDMIMLKDNHIDFSGGITQAIEKTKAYLKQTQRDLKIIVEARNLDEVEEILQSEGVDCNFIALVLIFSSQTLVVSSNSASERPSSTDENDLGFFQLSILYYKYSYCSESPCR